MKFSNHQTRTLGLLSLFLCGSALAASPEQIKPMEGSSGRGGGDPLALEFKASAEVALKNIELMKQLPFSAVNIALLQSKIDSAKIEVSDNKLPVTDGGTVQDSAAVNSPDENLIVINRADYLAIKNVSVQQALALHEFLSLCGLESTGNYPISGQYLIAEEGGNFNSANQSIGSAEKALVAETPCAKPNPDASTLFAMIADSGTSTQAIQSFLQSHAVAWDAINDQCETSFLQTVDAGRLDILQLLDQQYSPDYNVVQPGPKAWGNSIYSYVLGMGTPNFLIYLKKEADLKKKPLDLSPIANQSLFNGKITDLQIASKSNSHPEMIRYLIQNGSSVNAVKNYGWTALLIAADSNTNPEITQALISAGATVNATNSSGSSALELASWYNRNATVAQVLVRAGANVNTVDENGNTPLMIIAEQPSTEDVIEDMIRAGADVNAVNKLGSTPLISASQFNSLSAIQALLRAGANVTLGKSHGYEALVRASQWNPNPAVAETLVGAGISVNPAESGSANALEAAIGRYSPELAKFLIQKGAIVDALDQYGSTALQEAAAFNPNAEIIQLLLQSGAKPNLADFQGMTALMQAADLGKSPAVIDALIQGGADPNLKGANPLRPDSSITPLGTAAEENSNPEIILALIKGGANFKQTDKGEPTPLMYAASFTDAPVIVQTLIQAGSDVNAATKSKFTVLMFAACPHGDHYNVPLQSEIIRDLLKAGAKLDAKDAHHKTALDYAKKYQAPAEILNLLGG